MAAGQAFGAAAKLKTRGGEVTIYRFALDYLLDAVDGGCLALVEKPRLLLAP